MSVHPTTEKPSANKEKSNMLTKLQAYLSENNFNLPVVESSLSTCLIIYHHLTPTCLHLLHCRRYVETCGGTAQGAACVFPFTYKGITYNSCTRVDASQPWCSTESVYSSKWGYCNCDQGVFPQSSCMRALVTLGMFGHRYLFCSPAQVQILFLSAFDMLGHIKTIWSLSPPF